MARCCFCYNVAPQSMPLYTPSPQRNESELTSVRAQLSTTLSPSRAEQESRLHEVTESLIQKQTSLETLNAERNSLNLQLQRLQVQYPWVCVVFTVLLVQDTLTAFLTIPYSYNVLRTIYFCVFHFSRMKPRPRKFFTHKL